MARDFNYDIDFVNNISVGSFDIGLTIAWPTDDLHDWSISIGFGIFSILFDIYREPDRG